MIVRKSLEKQPCPSAGAAIVHSVHINCGCASRLETSRVVRSTRVTCRSRLLVLTLSVLGSSSLPHFSFLLFMQSAFFCFLFLSPSFLHPLLFSLCLCGGQISSCPLSGVLFFSLYALLQIIAEGLHYLESVLWASLLPTPHHPNHLYLSCRLLFYIFVFACGYLLQ